MRSISISTRIYIGLVITLALMAAVNIFLPQGSFLPLPSEEELVASIEVLAMINVAVVLILYGGLGFLGIILSKKLGFPDLWDSHITNRQRFFLPALVGAGWGFFYVADLFSAGFMGLERFSPSVSHIACCLGFGCYRGKIIFRLFFISFWVWLISHIILKKGGKTRSFGLLPLFQPCCLRWGICLRL